MWKPASRENVESDKHVLKSVASQMWKGVTIKKFGGEKGLGVVATRQFSRGDIICDYHGEVITAKKGNKKIEAVTDNAAYMFFFTFREKHLCIDAQTHPCKCHPELETVGRLINHSSKRPNLKPLQCLLHVDGKDTVVILFKALTEIKVDDELKFDYGVKRKSFRGEGLDLQWLDE
ncbi:N-lysine methyltransferase KMT5A-like [Anarrhichthys ocellatus]|uniref:N-lysine methyltransferase KMT5A-like n=1 Tax=Anarrhichthys ocellatus TaxID=433405 RepID=UPI0012EDA2A7|nr:N-lysine methyltransferase KMT5A-like [Anarrhichthys ocellatus]